MAKANPRAQDIGKEATNEKYLYLAAQGWLGLNLDGSHASNEPGEFRVMENIDLYDNYARTRRGFGAISINYNYPGTVLNGIVWKIEGSEYIIFAMVGAVDDVTATRFFWKNILTGDYQIMQIVGTNDDPQYFSMESDRPPSMMLSNNKIYVGAGTDGNFIIEWNSSISKFEIRALGLQYPLIESTSFAAGSMTGTFTVATEISYTKGGFKQVASSPSRLDTDQNIVTVNVVDQKIQITVDSDSLPSGGGISDYWTELNVYVSRRQGQNTDDVGNTIVYPGSEGELFYYATVDRATLESNSYVVEIDIPYQNIGIDEKAWLSDKIELLPLPPGDLIAYHMSKIYVSGCVNLDPTLSILFFSEWGDNEYGEQYNPEPNRVNVNNGDGYRTTALISLDNNLIIFKEVGTFVLQNGITDRPVIKVDSSIGVSHFKLCAYIPKLGIVAITSDDLNLKIFSRDLQWSNFYGKLEISRQVKSKIREYADNPYTLSFLYINEKFMIMDGRTGSSTECLVLHVGQGKGWTTYRYPLNRSHLAFTFSGGNRAAVVGGENPIMEIEKFDQYNDGESLIEPGVIFEIEVTLVTAMFQNNQGLDLLEFDYLQVGATLSEDPLEGTMYVSNEPWMSQEDIEFTQNPDALNTGEKTGVYQMALEERPAHNFMYAKIVSRGDINFNFIRWNGMIYRNMALNYINQAPFPMAPEITMQPEDQTVNLG